MVPVVVVGVILVVSCIVLLFLPYGQKYKTPEKFSGFGVQLEVSLLTALAVIGALMTIVPVAFPLYGEYQQFRKQLDDAQRQSTEHLNRISQLERALEESQKFDVWALVTLEGVTEQNRPSPSDVAGRYLAAGERDYRATVVTNGITGNQYRVLLTDVDRKTVLQRLVIEQPGKRRWVYENLLPMEPSLTLKLERTP